MTTNRPFLANFLAAFRAQSNPTFKASSASSSSAASSAKRNVSSTAAVSSSQQTSTTTSLSIAAKAAAANASQQATASTSPSSSSTATEQTVSLPLATPGSSPTSPSPLTSATSNTSPYHHHRPPSATSHRGPTSSIPIPPTRGRERRGSDSSNSSAGFREPYGSDKWYIGGRTAAGEERFYRLGLVTGPGKGAGGKRMRSLDRLSL